MTELDGIQAAGPDSGCACPGRADGGHGMLCEHILRGAFGHVGDAPEDVKRMLRDRGRLVPGSVVREPEPPRPTGTPSP